jgi:uncharacterized protein (TIGR00255 family)
MAVVQSMTGFAEKRFYSKGLSAVIRVKSLNHRFLDWSYRGVDIGDLENRLRAMAQRKLRRGRIEVSLELDFLDSASWSLHINEALLRKIFSSLERISSRAKRNINFSVESIFSLPHVVELRRKDFSPQQKAFLERSFERTLDEVLKMRKREGREIGKEVEKHLNRIKQMADRVDRLHKKQPFLIKERMRQRLKELNKDPVREEKLAEEAAFFAQRYDLHEEIARLKSHLEYAFELLSAKGEESVGKKLDFVLQELYREANTINSKSQEIRITKESLGIKGEVESIRQQVQNIE